MQEKNQFFLSYSQCLERSLENMFKLRLNKVDLPIRSTFQLMNARFEQICLLRWTFVIFPLETHLFKVTTTTNLCGLPFIFLLAHRIQRQEKTKLLQRSLQSQPLWVQTLQLLENDKLFFPNFCTLCIQYSIGH